VVVVALAVVVVVMMVVLVEVGVVVVVLVVVLLLLFLHLILPTCYGLRDFGLWTLDVGPQTSDFVILDFRHFNFEFLKFLKF
jgi:hypothetical protein